MVELVRGEAPGVPARERESHPGTPRKARGHLVEAALELLLPLLAHVARRPYAHEHERLEGAAMTRQWSVPRRGPPCHPARRAGTAPIGDGLPVRAADGLEEQLSWPEVAVRVDPREPKVPRGSGERELAVADLAVERATTVHFKCEVSELNTWYRSELVQTGVHVRMGEEATSEKLAAPRASAVAIASDSTPVVSRSIPGINHPKAIAPDGHDAHRGRTVGHRFLTICPGR